MCNTQTLSIEEILESLDFETKCNLIWITKGVDKECSNAADYSAEVVVNIPYCHWEQKFLCQQCLNKILSLVGSICRRCGECYYSSGYIIQNIVKL